MDNYFKNLSGVNVSDQLERKGEYSYLSWPFAVQQLRLADPTATWEVRRFDGLPYLKSETVGRGQNTTKDQKAALL